MPKLRVILLVIVAALLLGALPLRAQPTPAELLRFADDAPFNAVMFGAIRADSAYIETLDGVIAQFTSVLPSSLFPPTLSLSAILDLLSSQLTGMGFDQALRPILGDVAAFAVGDLGTQIDDTWYNDSEVPIALYLAVRDRAAAAQLIDSAALTGSLGSLDVTETPDGTLYTAMLRPTTAYLLLRDDSLIIAIAPDMLPNGGASLSDSPYFQTAVGSLPADRYNIIGYADVAALGSAIIGSNPRQTADSRIAQMLIFRALGVIAGGATILDGRTLTGDLVISPGSLAPFNALGIDLTGAPPPLDAPLLSRIPADSALVWHGTYPLGALDLVDRSVSGAFEAFLGELTDADPASRAALEALGGVAIYYPNALLTMLGGLTFEDYAEWLQGDYIAVLRPNLAYQPRSAALPIDGGIILESAGAESSRERMARLARDLTLMLRAGALARSSNIIPLQTRIGDADAVLLRAQIEDFSSRSVFYTDFAIAADDQVMVIGTRGFVEAVLGNAGAETSPFDADQGVVLPESRLALYVNPRALSAMALTLFGYNFDFDRPRIQIPLMALTLFDSSTASLTFDETGSTVMRFTLTLARDQAANAAAATAAYEAFAATAAALAPPVTATPFPTATATETPFVTPFATPTPIVEETAEAGRQIAIGETIRGSLAVGARDAYTLAVSSPVSIIIDMEAVFDTFLELRDSGDAVIMINDDRGDGSFNSRISLDLSPGTYIIIARAFSSAASGAYTLSVSAGSAAAAPTSIFTPIATPSAAGTIAIGETVTGNLTAGGRDAYTITVSAGAVITIDMEADFDTYLRLLDANGRVIAENDDRGDGSFNSRIVSFAVPAAGTYTISAGSFADAGGGSYTLTLSRG